MLCYKKKQAALKQIVIRDETGNPITNNGMMEIGVPTMEPSRLPNTAVVRQDMRSPEPIIYLDPRASIDVKAEIMPSYHTVGRSSSTAMLADREIAGGPIPSLP